jgi:hypothetical protein
LWPDEQSARRGYAAVRSVIARSPFDDEPEGTKYVASGGRRLTVYSSLDAAQQGAEESLLSR